ncbi:PP2C family protein-serine/threonine phosphatase, partial [Tychonema sp. BBK16]
GLFRSFIRLFSGGTNFQFCDREAKDSTAGMELEFDLYQRQALQAIEITNNYISEEHGETGMFATMFFGVLNPETGLLTYINGGHESPLIINASGIKTALKSTGPAVGMMPNMKFKIQQVQLEPGDILFGYTDGLTDARSPNREFFTEKRVLSLLNQPYSSASELLERMKTDVFTHIDCAAQFDDITLLAVRRKIPGTS